MVTLIDIRSYYMTGTDRSNLGYSLSLTSGALELLLICIIVNESRLTPTKPIITEEVILKTYPTSSINCTYRIVYYRGRIGPHFTLNLCSAG